MTDTPRFMLQFSLSRIVERVDVEAPTLISDEWLDQAWNMMNAFIMDMLDELGIEEDDEQFRTMFIEVCYRLIYREMFTLNIMPKWEKADLERLGTRERGPRINKKGSYDDKWNERR